MVPVLLPSTQISQLLEKLEEFGDESMLVRSVILLDKRYPIEELQAWADVWPEFTTILLKQKLSEIHTTYNYYMFSLVEENLKELLQNTDIVESENAIFRAYPYKFQHIVEDLANKRGSKTIYSDVSFNLYKFNTSKLKQRAVPEDVTVGSLTLDMADLVAKNWTEECLYEDKTLAHVKYLITTYPSVCVCDSKGTPIAYEVVQEYGGLGMLYVEPAYRNRGLGKLVTNLLVQKCIDYPPFVGIGPTNKASFKLHVEVGFENTHMFCKWAKVVSKSK